MKGEHKDTEEQTSKTALVPLREQSVEFYGDLVPIAQTPEGDVYVPLRPLADFLGLAFGPQRRRVLRDKVLAERAQLVVMAGTSGQRREMFCLPLDLLPGWLFGVSPSQARPELEEKLHRYRTDCFRVLWNAIKGEVLATKAPTSELSGAALALEIATAVQHLAQQQLEMETQLSQVAGRQEVMAEYLRGFIHRTDQRLHNLEVHLSAGATISEAQSSEIALAVKSVGQQLAAQGDKSGYAKVYGEMYRRYRISSYRNLPASKYEEVVDWLHRWYEELAGPGSDAKPPTP
ncbi:MAG TPA: phage antirepressor N-terminal domain-containing protein [Chloroflexia bacterium]|nr:phage antirepressor N-terminal domain-containing protein [Chloroflexia bacterium]